MSRSCQKSTFQAINSIHCCLHSNDMAPAIDMRSAKPMKCARLSEIIKPMDFPSLSNYLIWLLMRKLCYYSPPCFTTFVPLPPTDHKTKQNWYSGLHWTFCGFKVKLLFKGVIISYESPISSSELYCGEVSSLSSRLIKSVSVYVKHILDVGTGKKTYHKWKTTHN